MGEYFWGFIQLIKSKEAGSRHLEKMAEDAKTYPWENIRGWSEEVCAQIGLSRLNWADTYEIDRLQTKKAHKYFDQKPNSQGQADKGGRDERVYEIPENVKQGKTAPPCKDFQHGRCTHNACHISGGYRCLHICNYCLPNKCALLPHPL